MTDVKDADGHLLQLHDRVVVLRIPEWLSRGLPDEDCSAFDAQVGRKLVVKGFDRWGHVELHFLSRNGFHEIWIDGGSLRKVSGDDT